MGKLLKKLGKKLGLENQGGTWPASFGDERHRRDHSHLRARRRGRRANRRGLPLAEETLVERLRRELHG